MASLIAAADILVVDDHDIMRAMLRTVLKAAGARVVRLAANAAEALAHTECACPDLMLLDQTMPDISGLELLAQLRTRAPAPQPAVLMLTGHEDPAFAARALRAGAQGVLTKPVSNALLLQRIDTALAARATAQAV